MCGKKMKKGILIDGTGSNKWIGGLYYKKNIIFSLLCNQFISENFKIIVVTEKENKFLFDEFKDNIIPITLDKKGKRKNISLLLIGLRYNCKFIYPNSNSKWRKIGVTPIDWIPDFQHCVLPSYFSDSEVKKLKNQNLESITSNNPLILSSKTALYDLKKYYPGKYNNIYVFPFVSYIEKNINDINNENDILNKYSLYRKKYVCIMNQFWKHKNHIVVLKAIENYLEKYPDTSVQFVFTGKLEDYRNPNYISELKSLFESPLLLNNVSLLGFVSREDQIIIMKNSEFIIQPSLFEGWGTVVEDAKVLDKTILLSDIPVHHEQKNDKCILFNPYDENELADLIKVELSKVHVDNIEKGLEDMYERAKIYSSGFEKMLKDYMKGK